MNYYNNNQLAVNTYASGDDVQSDYQQQSPPRQKKYSKRASNQYSRHSSSFRDEERLSGVESSFDMNNLSQIDNQSVFNNSVSKQTDITSDSDSSAAVPQKLYSRLIRHEKLELSEYSDRRLWLRLSAIP
jgi:hypothetical protein